VATSPHAIQSCLIQTTNVVIVAITNSVLESKVFIGWNALLVTQPTASMH